MKVTQSCYEQFVRLRTPYPWLVVNEAGQGVAAFGYRSEARAHCKTQPAGTVVAEHKPGTVYVVV